MENEIKLEEVSDRVTKNKENITMAKKEFKKETEETVGLVNEKFNKLEESIAALTNEKLQSSSYTVPNLLSGSLNVLIEAVMVNQAKVNAAVQLGNSPQVQ